MGTYIKILLLWFFTLATLNISFSTNGRSYIGCIESEKQALLLFKQYLLDPANRLASWDIHDDDCCSWVGVLCDNATGHVRELHLGNPAVDEFKMLGGEVSRSLLNLKHLSHLDLSNNDFGGIRIPDFFGSMGSLRFLNLSNAGFEGLIPHQLGNLSNMQYLNLQGYELYVENLRWLAGLSQLKYLHMDSVNLSRAFDWLQTVNKLHSLKELHMPFCEFPPAVTLLDPNMSSLAILNLAGNLLQNTLPMISWISNLKALVSLDLRENDFEGPIPDGLRNLTSLRYLDLSHNLFNSSIPDWFYGFSPLESLYLFSNQLQGKISAAIGNMTFAVNLDLSKNKKLEGGIPRSVGYLCNLRSIILNGVKLSQNISDILEILSGCTSHGLESLDLSLTQLSGQLSSHLGHLKNLAELYLNDNSISGSIPESLGELSQLSVLDISNNKLKGNLPESLGQLQNLDTFHLFNNMLDGVVYEAHFANLTNLKYLDGIGNSITLKVHPNWIPPFQLAEVLYLGSWRLGPKFPPWLHSQKQLFLVDISNSGIADSVPTWFWNMSTQFETLNMSHNQIYGRLPYIPIVDPTFVTFDFSSNYFSGSLPPLNLAQLFLSNNSLSGSLSSFLCHRMNETARLVLLDLRKNLFSGELPDCWMNFQSSLEVIKLEDNNFTGSLPSSLGFLSSLKLLHLHNNNISRDLPTSLQNCSNLVVLDLSENELNGHIPTWLGPSLPTLEILNLRSNKLQGHLPYELCALRSLHILDLSHNNLSGNLPKCIGNFTSMTRPDVSIPNYALIGDFSYIDVFDNAFVAVKGRVVEYRSILRLVKHIDLSVNNFSGGIPEGVVRLQNLQSLNLSHNHLMGRIPAHIGAMTSLESMDFSENRLSGSIPQSISNLTFLSHLNLSNNDLSGKIPSSTQILGFDASSFTGNRLCGPPLAKNCTDPDGEIPNRRKSDGNGDEVDWFYVAMAIGFATGFGAVLVPLMLSRRWTRIYFLFLGRMWTRVLLLYAKATRF